MKRLNKANIPSLLISLLFSLILFFNVNSQTVSHFFSSDTNYEEAIQNVPVTVQYDQKKYFVHGFTNTVAVKLSSANRIQLNKEVDPDTRSFTVVADLAGLSTGTHEVKLQTKNLQNSIVATIEPKTVTVTIEKRATKKFEVTPVLSTTAGQKNRQIGEMSVEPETVEVTTGSETLKQIDRVIAAVDPTRLSASEDSIQSQVQALNANGESLPVQVSPQNVTVDFAMQKATKQVDLYPIQQGALPEGVESYKISLNPTKVTISGTKETLNGIASIGVPIDVHQVTETVKKTVTIPTNKNYKVTPASVNAQIDPVEKKSGAAASSQSASNSADASTVAATSQSASGLRPAQNPNSVITSTSQAASKPTHSTKNSSSTSATEMSTTETMQTN
ncbi:CdaR family protein [Enterococcus sp. CSURQ0835]|uniref:CdaR family protein n=1 Tax=Enterococcus sp. CSURQ0835 TaxID=2681394 RepID=UPI00135CF630|nr:CdaR family protein [Enterococcus sp. CSURQ0835]